MSLLNRMKAGAEQAAEKVKAGAEQAAKKAREEVGELQTKRELSQVYSELGKKTLELADRGELAHAEIADLVERLHTLGAQLEAERSEES